LVLAYAKRRKSGATAAEVDAALAELKSRLQSQGSSLERFLKEQSIGRGDLRRQITWNLTWEKYLAQYVTDARLQSHFKAHRREFDGTQLSVSHILLRPKADDDPKAMADLVNRAEAIRREITSGKLSFAEAAGRYSTGPSAKKEGRLGLTARRGAMVESFSRAAFALEVGQVSQPVTTRFGVHLIRCNAIKPGSKKWTEVREQLETALARELLDRLARVQQRYTPVEFTGKAPYFKPGTRELVLP
jgi:parvulin-like peptidyl-prolyl isomerase